MYVIIIFLSILPGVIGILSSSVPLEWTVVAQVCATGSFVWLVAVEDEVVVLFVDLLDGLDWLSPFLFSFLDFV